jgi:PAS domain S-box-containing protein
MFQILPLPSHPDTQDWLMYTASMINLIAGGALVYAFMLLFSKLERELFAMRTVQSVGAQLLHEKEISSILSKILDTAIELSHADFGNIQLLDPETSELHIVAHRGFPQWWIDYWERVTHGKGACGTALKEGKRVIIRDVKSSRIFSSQDLAIQLRANIHAVQSTPLLSRSGKPIGMFSTHYKVPHSPDSDELLSLDLLARQAADIIDHHQSQKAIQQSEMRFRALVTAGSQVVYRMDPDWSNMRELRGQNFLADTGKPGSNWPQKYILPEDQSIVWPEINKAIKTKSTFELEHRVMKTDGTVGWMFSRAVPLLDSNGNITEWFGAASDITDRKETQFAMEKMSSIMSEGQKIAHFGTFEYVADTKTTLWSEEEFRIYGLDPKEPSPSYETMLKKCIFPDDSHLLDQTFTTALNNQAEFELENRIVRPDGTIRWTYNHAHPYFDQDGRLIRYIGVTLDTTARKRAEETVANQLKEIETYYDSIPIGLAVIDRDCRFVKVNEILADINGVSVNDHIGKTVKEIVPSLEPQVKDIISKILSTGEPVKDIEFTGETKSQPGVVRVWLETWSPLRENKENIVAFIVTIMEITDRKHFEEQRLRNAELTAANKELESFSYSLSHDLRTPLHTIKGFAGILSEDYSEKIGTDGQNLLSRIVISADRMSELINDMLLLAKVSGEEIAPRYLNISAIVNIILSELHQSDPQRKVTSAVSDNLHAFCDVRLITIALSNLIGNAWKFTRKNPDACIEFGTTAKNDTLAYYVKDNGAGFDMRRYEKLFAPFQRLHTEKEYPGTGVGLNIVKRVIERHGGRIWAESEIGKGATFYFTLSSFKP